MTFQHALTILNSRSDYEANEVLDAAHLVVTEVAAHAQTDTAELGDWIESGFYHGDETPESIAAEWDAD